MYLEINCVRGWILFILIVLEGWSLQQLIMSEAHGGFRENPFYRVVSQEITCDLIGCKEL